MPDPVFESFQQSVPVSPPDPGEIRRRGDRRRRRTTIATVAGAVAVIVAVVAPVAVLTGGDERSERSVSTPTPDGSWLRTIPEGFPLGDGLPMPGEGVAGTQLGQGTTLTVCGAEVWSADQPTAWVDVASSTNADVVEAADGTDSRTLALYPDGASATSVLTRLAGALDDCSTRNTARSAETVDAAGGRGDAWVLHRSASPGPSDTLLMVTRVGNALLLQRDDLRIGVDEALAYVRARQASVLAAMCVFSADPCPSSAPPASPTGEQGSVAGEIPADFPIIAANDAVGSDFTVSRPSPDGQRVVLDPCGADAFDVPERDRLAFQVTGPEYADTRELRTYPSAGDAVLQMERMRAAVAGCPHDTSDPGGASLWSTHAVDTGYDSLAVATTYENGQPGGGIWLFTRVGRSILALVTGGEFAVDTVWDALPPLVDRTSSITPRMCLFTEAGC